MRPELNKNINPEQFLNYYWLKEDLYNFCKANNLPRSGSKQDLTDRIVHFLRTGEILRIRKNNIVKEQTNLSNISLYSIIPTGYKNDEKHRAFFKSIIGEKFKFNVPFMNWMKENSGKTYQEAINEWFRLVKEKKNW